MLRIAQNLTVPGADGRLIGKYNVFITNLPPNPSSSQGDRKAQYKQYLLDALDKKKTDLEKFKGKKVLVYLAVYLRRKRFETNDVDNFIKVILDALKVYIGDDKDVVSILTDKKILEGYPAQDLDFIEQVLLVITDPAAKSDLFK